MDYVETKVLIWKFVLLFDQVYQYRTALFAEITTMLSTQVP